MSAAETERRANNRDKVLELLKQRGSYGATNEELNRVCFRYGARIWDLRKDGYNIETKPAGKGLWRFVFHGRIQSQPDLFAEMQL